MLIFRENNVAMYETSSQKSSYLKNVIKFMIFLQIL